MSWDQLRAIIQDTGMRAEEERNRPPVACPRDGEPLRTGPDGELYCPFDFWRPGGPRV